MHTWAELMACAVFDHMTYCGKTFFIIVLRCGKRAQSFGHINPSINGLTVYCPPCEMIGYTCGSSGIS